MNRIRMTIMAFVLCTMFVFTSGCAALLLLGIGGAGGYLIKKGEDRKSSVPVEQVDRNQVAGAQDNDQKELALRIGGTER